LFTPIEFHVIDIPLDPFSPIILGALFCASTKLNIKGIDSSISTHRIIMEDDAKPFVDAQKRGNTKMKEVIRNKVIRLLDAGIIYQISDRKWVSHADCIPKYGAITIISYDDSSLIPTRTITGYNICIDFRKFNKDTKKKHKPPPLMEKILEKAIK
jgi:hypothetical protein